TVTVTGTGFTGATSVKFGTTAATSYTVVSATSITAVSPAGSAGTVDVTVTTPGGISATSPADEFTYDPVPTVTGVTPAAGPVAGGTTVTITGTGFTGATVDFGLTGASSVTVVSGTSITAVSPAGTGTVDVTVTTPGGISATSPADEFTYDPVPAVTGISPAAGPVAGGTTVTVTGTGFVTGATVDFGLTGASSVTVVSGTSITAVSPAGTGTVDVTVTTPGGTSATSPADEFTYDPVPTPTPTSPSGGGSAGGNDESGDVYRLTSYAVTAPGSAAGQTMTFAINEALSSGGVEFPDSIINVQVIPSQSLGPTQLTLTDTG